MDGRKGQEGNVPAKRDDQAPGVMRRDADDGLMRRDDDDVEGHSLHRGESGISSRDADGAVSRGGPDGVRSSITDEDDVEGHSMARDAGESLHRGLPGSGGEFLRRGPGDNPNGDR
jgi:hypothetical protein